MRGGARLVCPVSPSLSVSYALRSSACVQVPEIVILNGMADGGQCV